MKLNKNKVKEIINDINNKNYYSRHDIFMYPYISDYIDEHYEDASEKKYMAIKLLSDNKILFLIDILEEQHNEIEKLKERLNDISLRIIED